MGAWPALSYIGFYGVSLMTRSYTVLYVSLAAHLCQFLFLGYVENPRTRGRAHRLSLAWAGARAVQR